MQFFCRLDVQARAKDCRAVSSCSGFERPVARTTSGDFFFLKRRGMTDSTLRYTNIKKENFLYKLGITKRPQQMACDYRGDGLGVKGKSVSFMAEKKFSDAWENLTKEIAVFSGQSVPDVRWRGHIALWAASHALQHEGDFVECGVFTGILSGLICRYFDFEKIDRSFWLFDTWDGIPVENLQGADLDIAKKYN
jgi:hypothetical protein